jgi:hypothetical protein
MDYREELNAILLRIAAKDFQGKKPWNLDNFTENEIIILCKMIEWVVEDKGEEIGFSILSKAFLEVNEKNLKAFLKLISDAFEMGGEEQIVYPNALGFLLKIKQDYEN